MVHNIQSRPSSHFDLLLFDSRVVIAPFNFSLSRTQFLMADFIEKEQLRFGLNLAALGSTGLGERGVYLEFGDGYAADEACAGG